MSDLAKDAQAKDALGRFWPGYFKVSEDSNDSLVHTVNLHIDVMFGLNQKLSQKVYDEMSAEDVVNVVRRGMIPRITHDIVSRLVGETKVQMRWDRWNPVFVCDSCDTEFSIHSPDGKMPKFCPRCGRIICVVEQMEVGE